LGREFMTLQMHYSYNGPGALPDLGFPPFSAGRHECRLIAQTALAALYEELCAYPKPGLVSFMDSGSHRDMDANTFVLSLLSLRDYFEEVALAGMCRASFDELRGIGREAEKRMLGATGNINTHRGAIFTLGLLAAAAGYLMINRKSLGGHAIGDVVCQRWGKEVLLATPRMPCSHGGFVASQYGVTGAREEASAGFSHVFGIGLPVLEGSLKRGVAHGRAIIQTFFRLLAVVPDNNLLFRGGRRGLSFARASARLFLREDGVHRENWYEHACAIHREFIARHLSPGGTADLLAATLFINRLQTAQGCSSSPGPVKRISPWRLNSFTEEATNSLDPISTHAGRHLKVHA
jgi:triphosphoribosyl-dephospho-CoA synthase